MNIAMGLLMSFSMSLIGNLTSGHFQIIGFLISFVIECTQYLFSVGSFDVDDLLLNLAGVLIGYLINLWVHRCALERQKKRRMNIREIRYRD